MEDPIFSLERNLYCFPFSKTIMVMENGWEKKKNCSKLGMLIRHGLFLSVYVDDIKMTCVDDHQFKEREIGSVGELSSNVSSQIYLTCFYLTRIRKLDFLWSQNKFARTVTKWARAYDQSLVRLGNTDQQCRLA